MKTRLLIIIGIVIASSLSIGIYLQHEEMSNNASYQFDYKNTKPVIDDTFLGKNIKEWQNESFDSIMSHYENYPDKYGDGFFTKLGTLVIKNEMLLELEKQNIDILNPDFTPRAGMVLTSLPPHVSFEAFVNSTDGNVYRLSGMTQLAQVDNVGIKKLSFFDNDEKASLNSILSKNNTITIQYGSDTNPRVSPYQLLIKGDSDIDVNFKNNLLVPIRIQGDGDSQNPNWYGPTILPFTTSSMTFGTDGIYGWHARTLPLPGSISSNHMGGGNIFIISENMTKLSFKDRQLIGASILHTSEIPWSGMGGYFDGIRINLNPSIYDVLPNADEYYKRQAENLIPFDVPIIIERYE